MHLHGQVTWRHIWRSTVEKNICNQCDFACSDPSSLRTHLKTHTGEKLNKCNQCDFASFQAGHIWQSTVEKRQTNATCVILHPPMQVLWGHIWKRTLEKSQTNAINETMPLLGQNFWGDIWKRTVEKSQTNATNVTLHLRRQVIWGHIWKRNLEKSWTNVTNVTLHFLGQTFWGHTWKCTVEKSQTNATNATLHFLLQAIWRHIWRHIVKKSYIDRRTLASEDVFISHCQQCIWLQGQSPSESFTHHMTPIMSPLSTKMLFKLTIYIVVLSLASTVTDARLSRSLPKIDASTWSRYVWPGIWS